jgi:2-iminobutanoate/2-iminopropanoate deaminase
MDLGETMIQVVKTDKAPNALGPYSQAIVANGFVFVSGQIAIDPKTNQLLNGNTAEQTRQVLENLSGILQSVGGSLAKVVKATVFLQDLNDFAAMNAVYSEYFGEHKPARATVQVARLPLDARVEIDLTALA